MKSKSLKIIFFITSIVVLVGIITGIVMYRRTAWKRNFEIKYLDYDDGVYSYSITNLTQNTYKNVKAVIHVDNSGYDYSFESLVGTIHQNETVEYELYFNEAKKVAEEKNIKLLMANLDIEKLTWS